MQMGRIWGLLAVISCGGVVAIACGGDDSAGPCEGSGCEDAGDASTSDVATVDAPNSDTGIDSGPPVCVGISGALDPTFGTGGIATLDVESFQLFGAALQPDGKVVVVGLNDGANQDFFVARFDADGAIDTTFGGKDGGPPGVVITDFGVSANDAALGVAIDASSRIVVVGISGTKALALARYDASGALDPTFGSGGLVRTTFNTPIYGTAVALQGTKIVVGGSSPDVSANSQFAVARYNDNGSVDTTFTMLPGGADAGPGISPGMLVTPFRGIGGGGEIVDLHVQADQKIVALGDLALELARYTPNGPLDPTFGDGGIVANTDMSSTSMAVQPDEQIVAAGGAGAVVAGQSAIATARLGTSGNLDPTFGDGGIAVNPIVMHTTYGSAVVLQPDGKVIVLATDYVLTDAGTQASPPAFALARYSSTGAVDPTFGTGGVLFSAFDPTARNFVVRLFRLPDTRLLVVGASRTKSDAGINYDRTHIARFCP